MAKLTTQKARKEYVCEKCKQPILKGDSYYKVEAMYQRTKVRCSHCRPERSELTGSEYLSWLYDLQDHFIERYDLRSENGKEELNEELYCQQEELQSKLDNMPEQLQYGDAGQTLQDRISSIENAIGELDSIEFPEREDYSEDEEYESEIDTFESTIVDAVNSIEE